MPIAARTFPADINPPLSAASLRDGLRDALVVAGFPTPLKSYAVGTDQYAVWELNFSPAKAYGKSYYRLKVTSGLVCTHVVGATWTDSTNTLGNPSADSQSTTYASNVAVKSLGFKSDELTLLSVSQGSTLQLLGFFRFADAPAFDDVSFPKIFIPNSSDVASVLCTGVSPYTSSTFLTSLLNSNMSAADTYFQQRSQAGGFFLFGPTNTGIIARSSDDLAMGACVGMTRGDIFQVPDSDPLEQYILLRPGVGALLIRV
jgi:hypothetical protein